jgi:hypothetical protein
MKADYIPSRGYIQVTRRKRRLWLAHLRDVFGGVLQTFVGRTRDAARRQAAEYRDVHRHRIAATMFA